MKYYFYNKVAMAVLLALLLFFGTRTLVDIMFQEKMPETPGYVVAGAEEDLVGGDEGKKEEDKGAAFILALNCKNEPPYKKFKVSVSDHIILFFDQR